ncbi:hypothetical protein [Hoeflea poritis]|uniref:Uncharacterized protein n=1 Tax=Hoeflea poritis TaxID=2993659 RepID=A0ABT4VRW4_9HYPH|nr:hypothetical protein [Hoeflea poritis]MDA4847444.1 hypothetical protein [Hoeflea poritis]
MSAAQIWVHEDISKPEIGHAGGQQAFGCRLLCRRGLLRIRNEACGKRQKAKYRKGEECFSGHRIEPFKSASLSESLLIYTNHSTSYLVQNHQNQAEVESVIPIARVNRGINAALVAVGFGATPAHKLNGHHSPENFHKSRLHLPED